MAYGYSSGATAKAAPESQMRMSGLRSRCHEGVGETRLLPGQLLPRDTISIHLAAEQLGLGSRELLVGQHAGVVHLGQLHDLS